MTLRVAVTGAGGFVGSAIVNALQAAGARVFGLTGPDTGVRQRSAPGVEYTVCDITDVVALRRAFHGVDVVIHAAGPSSVFASLHQPVEFARVHVLGTASVVQAMRAEDVRSIVYISSAEVYARSSATFVRETDPVAPRSPYGAAKVGAEAVLTAGAASYGLRGFVLRPFSIYGSQMPASSVLGTIVAQAQIGNVITLADLRPVRDYCFVDDVGLAVAAACPRVSEGLPAMNLATGRGTSVRELTEIVGAVMQRKFDIRVRDTEQRPLSVQIPRLVGDNTAIRAALDWKPHNDIYEGLRKTLDGLAVA
jgi:nucleoside-diphosphate-sugar epimerase